MRELAADQIWNEHFKKVTEVAQAIAQAGSLRAATQGSDGAGVAASLKAEFRSSAITSGEVAVIGATVYDLEMKPIGAEWLKPEVQPPMDRLKPLAAREGGARRNVVQFGWRSEEHTSELQSLMRS